MASYKDWNSEIMESWSAAWNGVSFLSILHYSYIPAFHSPNILVAEEGLN